MPVPLIVKLPAGAVRGVWQGAIDDRNIEAIDIVPTIADVLDITLPWTVDGTSALGSSALRRDKKIYSKEATRVSLYLPGDLARERQAALDRALALFGTEAWPSPHVPGYEPLLDQRVESLRVEKEPSGLRLHLLRPLALEDVDVDAPAISAQIGGWVEPTDHVERAPVTIAIALNGQIVATTQTAPGQAAFSAILPPARLKNGSNRLEAFLLRADRPNQLYGSRREPPPRDANLVLSEATAWGVEHSGLYRAEKGSGNTFRWTNGAAVIDVPIEPQHPPATLEIATGQSGPPGKKFIVRVDGCSVVSETLKAGGWSRTIELDKCIPKGYWARIEIQSDTHKPQRDGRRLGVALLRVMLHSN